MLPKTKMFRPNKTLSNSRSNKKPSKKLILSPKSNLKKLKKLPLKPRREEKKKRRPSRSSLTRVRMMKRLPTGN